MNRCWAWIGLVVVLIIAGCSGSNDAPGGGDSPSDGSSVPTATEASPTSAEPPPQPSTTEAVEPSEITPTPVDPAGFADVGAERYAFSLPSDGGICWIAIGAETIELSTDMPPSVHCLLPIDSYGEVTDRRSGEVGEPVAAVIDGNGAWPSLHGPVGDGAPPVLKPSESLTVSHMTCEINAASELRCFAQTGEFTFDGQTLEVVKDLPSPYPATGAGVYCGAFQNPATMMPIYITAGKLSCDTAVATMTTYLSMPLDPDGGTLHERSFDGWLCVSHSIGTSEWTGVSKECTADGQRIIVPV